MAHFDFILILQIIYECTWNVHLIVILKTKTTTPKQVLNRKAGASHKLSLSSLRNGSQSGAGSLGSFLRPGSQTEPSSHLKCGGGMCVSRWTNDCGLSHVYPCIRMSSVFWWEKGDSDTVRQLIKCRPEFVLSFHSRRNKESTFSCLPFEQAESVCLSKPVGACCWGLRNT